MGAGSVTFLQSLQYMIAWYMTQSLTVAGRWGGYRRAEGERVSGWVVGRWTSGGFSVVTGEKVARGARSHIS